MGLLDTLGVLRSPQTRADRRPALTGRLRDLVSMLQDPGPERLDQSLVRVAGTTPWRSKVVLAGFTTVGVGRPSEVPEMLGAFVSGEIGARAPASEIRHRGLLAYFDVPRRGAIRVVLVVPDGVVRVAFRIPARNPITLHVMNNVSAFVIRRRPEYPELIPLSASMIWYGRQGVVIRRVASPGRTH